MEIAENVHHHDYSNTYTRGLKRNDGIWMVVLVTGNLFVKNAYNKTTHLLTYSND